jgi:hypothetical protein
MEHPVLSPGLLSIFSLSLFLSLSLSLSVSTSISLVSPLSPFFLPSLSPLTLSLSGVTYLYPQRLPTAYDNK